MKALVRYGWDVNRRDLDGETALFRAEDGATVRALVACGATINIRDRNDLSPLACRSTFNSPTEAGAFEALLDLGARDVSAFVLGALLNNPAGVKMLLDHGWNVDMPKENGSTPLMFALSDFDFWKEDSALLLIRRGANVNAQNKEGTTPLHLVAGMGLSPGGTPSAHSKKMVLVVLNALLARGAHVNTPDHQGETPLMIAAENLRPDLVRILLQHGARVNLRTKERETALSMTRQNPYLKTDPANQSRVIRILRAAGARE